MEAKPWIANTPANPFYKSKVPVEIKLKDGTVMVAKCPKCRRTMSPYVKEWRPL